MDKDMYNRLLEGDNVIITKNLNQIHWRIKKRGKQISIRRGRAC